jgi:hypothetical protein
MRLIGNGRVRLLAATIAAVTAAGIGVAAAGTAAKTPSNAVTKGVGIGEFGMTESYFNGHTVNFTYSKGFFCDTSIKSHATTGCEVGTAAKHKPSKASVDPLFITVPLFKAKIPAMQMQCPNKLACVDHPGTIDLTRLEKTLHTLPAFSGDSNKALTAALRNYATPGHEHFITTTNGGKGEWWNVEVVGVPTKSVYDKINKHESYGFVQKEIKAGKAVGPVPSNLFLYFSVQK